MSDFERNHVYGSGSVGKVVFDFDNAESALDEYKMHFNTFKAQIPEAVQNDGFSTLAAAGFDILVCKEFDAGVEQISSTVETMDQMARTYFANTQAIFNEEQEEMPEVDMPGEGLENGITPFNEGGPVPADYDIPQDGNRAGGFGIDGINTNSNLPSGGGNVVSEISKEAIRELLDYVGEKQANEALDSKVLKERLENMNKPDVIKEHDIDEEMKYSDENSKISDDFINPRKAVPGTGPMPNEGTTYDDDLSLRYSEDFANSMGAKSRGPVAGTEPTPVKGRGTTYDGDQSLKYSEEFAESMGAKSRGPVAGTEPTLVKGRGTTYDSGKSFGYSEGTVPNSPIEDEKPMPNPPHSRPGSGGVSSTPNNTFISEDEEINSGYKMPGRGPVGGGSGKSLLNYASGSGSVASEDEEMYPGYKMPGRGPVDGGSGKSSLNYASGSGPVASEDEEIYPGYKMPGRGPVGGGSGKSSLNYASGSGPVASTEPIRVSSYKDFNEYNNKVTNGTMDSRPIILNGEKTTEIGGRGYASGSYGVGNADGGTVYSSGSYGVGNAGGGTGYSSGSYGVGNASGEKSSLNYASGSGPVSSEEPIRISSYKDFDEYASKVAKGEMDPRPMVLTGDKSFEIPVGNGGRGYASGSYGVGNADGDTYYSVGSYGVGNTGGATGYATTHNIPSSDYVSPNGDDDPIYFVRKNVSPDDREVFEERKNNPYVGTD